MNDPIDELIKKYQKEIVELTLCNAKLKIENEMLRKHFEYSHREIRKMQKMVLVKQ